MGAQDSKMARHKSKNGRSQKGDPNFGDEGLHILVTYTCIMHTYRFSPKIMGVHPSIYLDPPMH
jgi:hypothetical protein